MRWRRHMRLLRTFETPRRAPWHVSPWRRSGGLAQSADPSDSPEAFVPMSSAVHNPASPSPTRIAEIFNAFALVGLTSFGGGLSGRMLQDFVQQRHWIGEDDFFEGLALAQALPGVNVTNLAIWIGFRLRGWQGAAAGFTGIVMPAAMLIVLLGALFTAL